VIPRRVDLLRTPPVDVLALAGDQPVRAVFAVRFLHRGLVHALPDLLPAEAGWLWRTRTRPTLNLLLLLLVLLLLLLLLIIIWEVIANELTTDVECPLPSPCVCMTNHFTLKASQTPIAVECLCSMTLLRGSCDVVSLHAGR